MKTRNGKLATIFVTGVVTLMLHSAAYAVPASQRSCSVTPNDYGNLNTIQASDGWQPVAGISVTVNNGTTAKNVILQFAADAGVDDKAEIRLGYSVDGGPVEHFGPQNFANHTQYWETRYNLSVATIGAGVHTIVPFWRISGIPSAQGVMDDRCLTAERVTQ